MRSTRVMLWRLMTALMVSGSPASFTMRAKASFLPWTPG